LARKLRGGAALRSWRVPYPKFGAGPGLERVSAVAAHLGINLAAFGADGVAIVGSNGKGSTAAMTASLLRQTGRLVGLFTSPHLFDLNERFNIDGEDIRDDELDLHWRRVMAAVEGVGLSDKLGGFEFLFLIAASWFADRHIAHTVWEAGIGGRLDPVRLIEARRVALTSLDLEHTELLGDTLEEIARDKIDAAPKGARLFVNEGIAALAAIENHARERGVVLEVLSEGARSAPLNGVFQCQNARLAVALAREIAPLTDANISAGLAATRWPGRLEVIEVDPLIVIDVGHTPAGVRAALEGFRQLRGDRDATLVCGVSADKDAGAIISALAPDFAHIICASALHKGAPAAYIAAHASAANPAAELAIAESVSDARTLAITRAKPGKSAIYVAGGLFLAAEFKAVHLGRDPASLAFF
jgi:dihydrofolate synthase / folylpolyglutamate synthase